MRACLSIVPQVTELKGRKIEVMIYLFFDVPDGQIDRNCKKTEIIRVNLDLNTIRSHVSKVNECKVGQVQKEELVENEKKKEEGKIQKRRK